MNLPEFPQENTSWITTHYTSFWNIPLSQRPCSINEKYFREAYANVMTLYLISTYCKKMNPTLNEPVRSRMWACPQALTANHALGPRHSLCVCISYTASGETGQQAQAEFYTRTCLLVPGGWSGSGWALGKKNWCWILNAECAISPCSEGAATCSKG